MTHLRNRFCLIPFSDLTDCPTVGHHAIGSPYFDPFGRSLFSDPIVIAVRADIVDTELPRCSVLAVSCNTRPFHSYGPVMRAIFEKSKPHKYPEVRRGLEGVMEIGDVKKIPSGGLEEQADMILLGCVATMTAGTNEEILLEVLGNFSREFAKFPAGSTLRMPLIGTGKARSSVPTEQVFRDIVAITISKFLPTLIAQDAPISPRRMLLVHPLEYESHLIASSLAERAVFLTLLDKMGLMTTDKRLVYGIAHGDKKENQFVNEDHFDKALDHFDTAINHLLDKKRKKAIIEAARGVEIEPALSGIYTYIHSLASKKTGVMEAVTNEVLNLAKEGRIRDAYCVAHNLESLGGKKKEKAFVSSLKDCYIDYCVAALESRLLYENYMETEEVLQKFYQGIGILDSTGTGRSSIRTNKIPKNLVEGLDALEFIEKKIPMRIIENTYHIVIRKFMANRSELLGARRALDNLMQLKNLEKITLAEEDERICSKLYELANYIEEKKELITARALHKDILDALLEILPDHGTLRLEAARFHLKLDKDKHLSITRADIEKAWKHLEIGHQKNPRDYGILSYLGFVILLQGEKQLSLAQDFFMLFGRLIEDELVHGKYGIRRLKSPRGGLIDVPIIDEASILAYEYYDRYKDNAKEFEKLTKALTKAEGTAAINAYTTAIQHLALIGRYDLAKLYDELLGKTWVALLARSQQSIGSIPLPFGEISIDLIVNVYKKMRRWWKYRNLKSREVRNAISSLLKNIEKRISNN